MNIKLIAFRRIDAERRDMVREWRNREEVRSQMVSDAEIDPATHLEWFERVKAAPDASYWLIEVDGRDAGVINLSCIDSEAGTGYWAFYLVDARLRKRGLGRIVEYEFLNFLFNALSFRSVFCEVLESNRPVLNMHAHFGFKYFDTIEDYAVKNGHALKGIVLSLSRERWMENMIFIRDQRLARCKPYRFSIDFDD
ncbi:UDP-4-amino-4,6-dideoxy-N-acetyl-beta-L-altrosamine N-acetyltransferase [Litoricolaceae bacterium]|nr:UDP-4-amino-4,6-dideoxy-N-acetyl-beta-L-altrosamine N-acetyltransferase [Litorivicinaceae bacterium]